MMVAPGAYEEVFRIDHQQLIAPDNAAFAVDRADAVAVAVESNSEVEVLLGDERLKVLEVFRNGGIGMVIGKVSIDLGVEAEVLARQARDERFERGTGGAVACVPATRMAESVAASIPSRPASSASI